MSRLSIVGMLFLVGMVAVVPWGQTVQSATANSAPQQNCFAEDPAIGGTNRDDHFGWAQRQDSGRLENNLRYKIGLLFNCSAVDGEKLAQAFADISVIIANYVPGNEQCFTGDRVTDKNRSAHEGWARTKTRNQVRDNLQWKAAGAIRCLDRNAQNNYFADVSVVVAKVPSASTGGGGGGGGGGGCQGASNSVTVNPNTARTGQTITVQVTTTAPPPDSSTRSWVALFPASGQSHLGQWKWLHDGQNCGFTFRAPDAPGQYEFRYFLDSGYDKVAARGYFTVQ